MERRIIRYYDAKGRKGEIYLRCVFHYLIDEWNDKKQAEREDWKEWKLEDCASNYPCQANGELLNNTCYAHVLLMAISTEFDCGVFICMHAEFLLGNLPMNFNQNHATIYREKMLLSMLNQNKQEFYRFLNS